MRTLTIPAPAPWVSANDRSHWATKARRTHHWRIAAGILARATTPNLLRTPVAITVTVHRTSGRRADASNLAPTAKACIDGLVDAGWLPDADDQHVIATTFVAGEPLRPACLTLTITEQGDPT